MMPELIPYPLPSERLGVVAVLYSKAIEKYGFSAVAEERIRQMSKDAPPTDLLQRILRNTCLAFSAPQVRRLVKRELIEVTGRRWTSVRKGRPNAR